MILGVLFGRENAVEIITLISVVVAKNDENRLLVNIHFFLSKTRY